MDNELVGRSKKRKQLITWGSIMLLTLVILIVVSQIKWGRQMKIEAVPVEDEVEIVGDTITEFGIPISEYNIVNGVVKKGDLFSTILNNAGVSQRDIHNISQSCKEYFNVGRDLKIGNSYRLFYTLENDSRPDYFLCEVNSETYVVFELTGDFNVRVYDKPVRREIKYAEVEIVSSLWNDVIKAGHSYLLALKLSDIYAWSIDFFALQKGDSFKAVYEELDYEGEKKVGSVYYALFSHGKRDFEAYNFIQSEENSNRYWNEKGESLRKSFLKAPLSYSRVSSGFSYARKHPVTQVVRPHTGVDYAAPAGTPVMTIGDGVVVERGYKGDGGNTVKIKHNSVYTTAYLHLSKYAAGLKVGDRVKQGEVIGYVGSTGTSTGPHLDFRVWKNGTPINPLRMESPPAEPVDKENMPRFEEMRQYRLWQRDSIGAQTWVDGILEKLEIRR